MDLGGFTGSTVGCASLSMQFSFGSGRRGGPNTAATSSARKALCRSNRSKLGFDTNLDLSPGASSGGPGLGLGLDGGVGGVETTMERGGKGK